MKYKVGDKVKVRSDLVTYKTYGEVSLMPSMKEFLGKVVKISHVDNTFGYHIKDLPQFLWTDEMFEGRVEITKDDLKTGMIVTLRNGSEYMVILNHVKYPDGLIMSFTGEEEIKWDELNQYTDDLLCRTKNCGFDIIKIQSPITDFLGYKSYNRITLWKREEVKKVTMKEVEEKFGCKVEIVD